MQLNRTPIIYQIYPKSFYDSDGDGIGDIQGIIEKLDYLQDLGIDMIWMTPVFTSPQNDNGYDVADYKGIDPIYGTMDEMDLLIEEAKKRNIGIMLDMVFNHSSTFHPWFQKALIDQDYREYYFFKEKPTNWQSKFGGNAWEYVENLNLYYLHLFDVTQADLNWEHPQVMNEIKAILNFWLEKGVLGFRFDVINLISKPDVFEDDLQGDGRRMYTDGVNVAEYLQEINQESFGAYPQVVTVGELSSTSIEKAVSYAKPENGMLSTVFNFHHLKVDYKDGDKWRLKPFDFVELKQIYSQWQHAMDQENATMSLFLNNHDQPRAISRFADDLNFPFQSASMLATTLFLMKGMPYLYQGEEIGLPNACFEEIDSYRDVESINMYRILREKLPKDKVLEILSHRSRDNSRTPIPWNDEPNYGFTQGLPWIPFSQHPNLKSVEENIRDSDSILHYYRKLLRIRREGAYVSLIDQGKIHFEMLDDPDLFVYSRVNEDIESKVISNFSNRSVSFNFKDYEKWKIVIGNYENQQLDNKNTLKPFETIFIVKD